MGLAFAPLRHAGAVAPRAIAAEVRQQEDGISRVDLEVLA